MVETHVSLHQFISNSKGGSGGGQGGDEHFLLVTEFAVNIKLFEK